MKPFAALGICLALLAAPAFGQTQTQTPERAALLARLKVAIPKTNAPPFGARDADEVRQTLLPLNPGREAEVEALASAKFTCLNSQMTDAFVLDLIVSSVDQRMTQPEIERLVTFYEGPEYKALAALDGRPADDPAKQAAGVKLAAEPAFLSFMRAMQGGITDYMGKPGVMDSILACDTTYREALEKSGLKQPGAGGE